MISLAEARSKILERAEPREAIEVALTEAVGLVLAEPVIGDVDLPPFDRSAVSGYACLAADAKPRTPLRVVGSRRGRANVEVEVGPDEITRVSEGDPIPVGADAIARVEDALPEPFEGFPRFVEVLRRPESGQNVVPRGHHLRAGAEIVPAGIRLRLPMIGLLAAQGCTHPVCHRRVRVAVLAVGEHLVGPGEAPIMNRERNAVGLAVVAPCLQWGATAHDLGAVAEDALDAALARALTAPVVVVLGPTEGPTTRALGRAGVEPIVSGISLYPEDRVTYGVVHGPSGQVEHHVFHLPANVIAATTVTILLIGPLIARLHGGPATPGSSLRAIWDGSHRATDDRTWAVPVTLETDGQGRFRASPISLRGRDDLPGFARADGLALLPAGSGPWLGGELVEVAPIGPWLPD